MELERVPILPADRPRWQKICGVLQRHANKQADGAQRRDGRSDPPALTLDELTRMPDSDVRRQGLGEILHPLVTEVCGLVGTLRAVLRACSWSNPC
jgi:hypothetical protein